MDLTDIFLAFHLQPFISVPSYQYHYEFYYINEEPRANRVKQPAGKRQSLDKKPSMLAPETVLPMTMLKKQK